MTPTFSVIIPTYQRPAELSQCLASLNAVDYPRERFEVIVVNDGGPSIDDVVAPFAGQMNVRHVTQQNAGPAAARNTGVARAQGKYIAFTDDDCLVDPAWLTEMEGRLAADDGLLVGGRTINALDNNVYSEASQLLMTYLYEYYNANIEQAQFFASNNMALAREHFLSSGGFDAEYRFAEDRELCDRWRHSGRRMVQVETALIRHFHWLTLRSFWQQHFGYGRGAVRYRQDKAQRDATPVRVEPLRFYSRMFRSPWTSGVPRPMRTSALLFLSQVANAMGFFREKFRGEHTPE